jgi:HSP20 family molecular chaperone IbpA
LSRPITCWLLKYLLIILAWNVDHLKHLLIIKLLLNYSGFIGSPDFRPRVIDVGPGQKQIKMALAVKNYRPEQIKVSVKNNELLVQAENVYNDNNRSERSFLTKSISLPPGTQADKLQSFLNADGQLEIEAPFFEPTQVHSIEVQH